MKPRKHSTQKTRSLRRHREKMRTLRQQGMIHQSLLELDFKKFHTATSTKTNILWLRHRYGWGMPNQLSPNFTYPTVD